MLHHTSSQSTRLEGITGMRQATFFLKKNYTQNSSQYQYLDKLRSELSSYSGLWVCFGDGGGFVAGGFFNFFFFFWCVFLFGFGLFVLNY